MGDVLKRIVAAPTANGRAFIAIVVDVIVENGVVRVREFADYYLYGKDEIKVVQRPMTDRGNTEWPLTSNKPENVIENERIEALLAGLEACSEPPPSQNDTTTKETDR